MCKIQIFISQYGQRSKFENFRGCIFVEVGLFELDKMSKFRKNERKEHILPLQNCGLYRSSTSINNEGNWEEPKVQVQTSS